VVALLTAAFRGGPFLLVAALVSSVSTGLLYLRAG
jgi:hypothetical protein